MNTQNSCYTYFKIVGNFNPDDISAYVITNLDKNKKKLRVILKNVPEYVKVLSIDPPKLDYIIQK